MDTLVWLFWNREERRLRFLWRFLVFVLIFVPIMAGTQTLLYVLAPGLIQALKTNEGAQFIKGWALSEWLQLIALFITLVLVARWVDRRPFRDYGFALDRAWWVDFLFGLLLGAVLMTGIFSVEYLAGWVKVVGTQQVPTGMSFSAGIFWAAVLFLAVGLFEELLSRGYLLHNLAEGLNFSFWSPAVALVLAWVLSSLVFGLGHLGNPNATWVSTANLVVAGLFLGLGYVLTGELAIPIGLHITWNFFQGNVFGFPVSGTASNSVSFLAIEQQGPDLWTGGRFGPEAGLIGLLAVLIGAILVLVWVRWHHGALALQERIPLPPTTAAGEQNPTPTGQETIEPGEA